MPIRNRRRRRSRFALPRQVRLAISAAVLVVIIVGIVLLVRGCVHSRDDSAAPASETAAPEETETIEPAAQMPEDEPISEPTAEPTPETTPMPAATPSAETMANSLPFGSRSAVIRSIGDIVMDVPLLKGAYASSDKSYDFSSYFSQIKPSMEAADYTIINVDGPLGGKKFASYRGYPQFNTPPVLLNTLAECGVDMLTLANNHALDTYFDGLVGTIDNVEKVGFDHVGAYRTQQERDTPKVVVIGGIRVGFANYTVSTNNMIKRSDAVAKQYGLALTSNSNAPQDIQRLRDAGAEVVVVLMHWGKEYERTPDKSVKNMAAKLVAAGADVVIGGHQHVVLPGEYVTAKDAAGGTRTGLVLYGMGNFLSDHRQRYMDSGIIFEMTLRDNPQTGRVEVVNPRYIPVYVQRIKNKKTYDYRVWAVGDTIEHASGSIPSDVLTRMRQVWQEQEAIFAEGPLTAGKK